MADPNPEKPPAPKKRGLKKSTPRSATAKPAKKPVKKTVKKVTAPAVGSEEWVALALNTTMKGLEKRYGKGVAYILEGELSRVREDYDVISTGSYQLDSALGIGGFPRGRFIEIYGEESSGKTTLALQVIANAQKMGGVAAFIDAEHALDVNYAEDLGVQLDKMILAQPDSGEQALQIANDLVDSGAVAVIAVDSVSALTPQAELDGDIGDSLPGLQARLMGQALRKMRGKVLRNNVLFIFLNQTREKIGVRFGSPKTTSGGKALRFYASQRVELARIASLKKSEVAYGNRTKATIRKNKCAPPFRTAEFDLIYGEGIDNTGEILDLAVKFGVLTKTGSWYVLDGVNVANGRANGREWMKEQHEMQEAVLAQAFAE